MRNDEIIRPGSVAYFLLQRSIVSDQRDLWRYVMQSIPANGLIPHNNVGEGGSWLSGVTARLHRISSAWAARRRTAREAAELYRFSDRELRDVGLVQADIAAIVGATMRRD
jgi:uncharacterized protein YjiS (DUF1127 family)